MAEPAAGERTEEPTPRKLADARRRGDVASSRDLTRGAVLAAVIGAVALGAAAGLGEAVAYLREAIEGATGAASARRAGLRALETGTRLLALPLAAAAAAAAGMGLLQSRGLIAPGAVGLDLDRVRPRLGRVMSRAALAEMAKGLLKVLALLGAAWIVVEPLLPDLPYVTGASAREVLSVVAAGLDRVCLRLGGVILAFGAADYLWQGRLHRQRLRMTRDEIRREHKEAEGDPRHKAERQRLHRELAEQRMLADVRKADFVVVNPDHIAVALRYDREGRAAPVVVAKGERLLAERIKDVAREAGVPIFRDVTLARSLRDVEEGGEIPEALYEAVAEILRVVYAMPDESGRRQGPASEPAVLPGEPARRQDLAVAPATTRAGSHWRRV